MTKVIVVDDDPTGSQTVHGCLLLLSWRVETLVEGLQHPADVLFILANTRALPRQEAEDRLRAVCRNLRRALRRLKLEDWQLVSRGDSTLRGHFPLDGQVLGQELGPFAVWFLLPAFLPGGRTTVDGHHLLHGRPVHLSSYARDSRFGYSTSSLAAWVEQKSGGHVPQATVTGIHWGDGRRPGRHLARLAPLPQGSVVTVDASEPVHLRCFGQLLLLRRQQGHRDLCWGAASLVNALVDPGPQTLQRGDWAGLRRRDARGPQPGLILVGSHQSGADRQLAQLLTAPSVKALEIPLERLLQDTDPTPLAASLAAALGQALQQERRTVVLYTSRGERLRGDGAAQLALAQAVAQLQETLLTPLRDRLGYAVSKGGSTTDTLLRHGLALDRVVLRGQVMAGISLVQPVGSGGQAAALPVICVPGNMGTDKTLLDLHRLMEPEHALG